MKPGQLALNSISLDCSDLPAALKAVRAAGFGKIEFYLGHVKDYLKQGHTVAELKDLLDGQGLACIGGFECPLESFSDKAARAANHQRLVENAELLAVLGGTNLVVGTDGPKTGAGMESLDVIAENLHAVARRVAPAGVSILIEFNWGPLVKSLRTAAEIVRRSGAPNAGVLFDPAHYHCTPTKLDQLNAENIALIRHVHVNDMRDRPGELSNCNADRVLPGSGCLDLAGLFGRIETHGYAGDFSIEMFDDSLRALPPAEAAARMHRSLLPLCPS